MACATGANPTKTTWYDPETRALIQLWEEHLSDLRRSGAICWPYYWEIHRFLGTLPLQDESFAEESGFSQGSPAQEFLQGIARGDVQDEQQSQCCSSPLVVASEPSCSTQTSTSPQAAGNSTSTSLETAAAASSCEAGLDGGGCEKEPKKRKRQPAPSTLMTQLLDEQRQLRLSLEQRREKELQLKEEQLKIFKGIAAMDEKLLSVLEALVKK
ncbi:hypothetical protein HPB52_000280 [Rhipicephalus sanguineus]|uniref:Uncharacterized protein n=1 Tax=Rhipicephalus sanguineus TaxID=34632 RepID=A0A9D4PT81_RHISA|nr:hypothetical protein HPB52_000280 [Rhipicephalus sanguineus]